MNNQPPEANFLIVVGQIEALQKIVDAWPRLVDTEELRSTPVLEISQIPELLLAEMPPNPTRVGRIEHASGLGGTLCEHLVRECRQQLGLVEGKDFAIDLGFYFTV